MQSAVRPTGATQAGMRWHCRARGLHRLGRTVVKADAPGSTQTGKTSMDGDVEVLKRIYDRFNARDIDNVLVALADDVAWANGMDGGHVRGRVAVREYWTRQWAVVSPHVEPVSFDKAADGAIVVEVRQSVRDLEGRPLQDPTHGLTDRVVGYVFRLQDGKVTRFDIQEAGGTPAGT